jgi:hypothetical protein
MERGRKREWGRGERQSGEGDWGRDGARGRQTVGGRRGQSSVQRGRVGADAETGSKRAEPESEKEPRSSGRAGSRRRNRGSYPNKIRGRPPAPQRPKFRPNNLNHTCPCERRLYLTFVSAATEHPQLSSRMCKLGAYHGDSSSVRQCKLRSTPVYVP